MIINLNSPTTITASTLEDQIIIWMTNKAIYKTMAQSTATTDLFTSQWKITLALAVVILPHTLGPHIQKRGQPPERPLACRKKLY